MNLNSHPNERGVLVVVVVSMPRRRRSPWVEVVAFSDVSDARLDFYVVFSGSVALSAGSEYDSVPAALTSSRAFSLQVWGWGWAVSTTAQPLWVCITPSSSNRRLYPPSHKTSRERSVFFY